MEQEHQLLLQQQHLLLVHSRCPDITVRNLTGVAATFTGVVTYEDVTNVILLVSSLHKVVLILLVVVQLTVTGVSTFFDDVRVPRSYYLERN